MKRYEISVRSAGASVARLFVAFRDPFAKSN